MSKNRDDRHKSLIACEAQEQQYQMQFDREECKFNMKMAEDEKHHNETVASQLKLARAEEQVANAAAVATRDIAAAAWATVTALDGEGSGIKSAKQQAAKGNFETFFKKQILIEEEERRRIERQREAERLSQLKREEEEKQRAIAAAAAAERAAAAKRNSYSYHSPPSDRVWGEIGSEMRKHFWPTKEEQDEKRWMNSSNPGGCSGMDTSNNSSKDCKMQ